MLLRHGFSYLLARGMPGIINLFALSLFTRLLSPQDYGQYALVLAGTALANAVLFQWLRLGLLRYLPAWRDRVTVFLSTVIVGYAALVVLTAVVAAPVIFFLVDPVLRGLVALSLLFLWLEAFFELNQELARSQFSPQRYGILALLKSVVALAVGGLLGYLGLGAVGLLLGSMSGILVAVGLLFRRNWGGVRWHLVDRPLFREFLAYGLPLTATFALGFIVASFDRILLGWFRSADEAGLYAVGYDLAKQTIAMLLMVINLAAYPLAVRALEEKGGEAARDQLRQNGTALLLIGLPAATGMALLAPNIAQVFLGASFRTTAAELIPWIALGSLLAGFKSYYLDLSFQLGRSTSKQAWIALGAASVNLACNFFWIPLFGPLGAAWATVAAYATGLLLSWRLGQRVFPLPWPGAEARKIVLASIGMALVLLPLRHLQGSLYLGVQVAAGGLTFAILVLLLRVFPMINGRLPLLAKAEGSSRV